MADRNPYAPPQAPVAEPLETDAGVDTERVASGQKLVIYSILVYFFAVGLQAFLPLGALLIIPSIVMGMVGLVRLGKGFGWSTAKKVLAVIVMIVPLVGLITLLRINRRANKTLSAAGYRVALLGASKKR